MSDLETPIQDHAPGMFGQSVFKVGRGRDGRRELHRWVESDEKPWLLSLLDNNAYSLGVGDIMHQLEFVPGAAGHLERAIEKSGSLMGLNVMKNRGKALSIQPELNHGDGNVIYHWMQHLKPARYLSYALLLGHREALKQAQREDCHGLDIFHRALNEWQFESPLRKLSALEILYDLMSENMKLQAKSEVNNQPIDDLRRSVIEIQTFNQQPLFLSNRFASTDRLFPEIFTPIKNPPAGLDSPIPQSAVNIFKGFTLQRIDATFAGSTPIN